MNFSIQLTSNDIALLGSLLEQQPYKQVVDLIRRVQAQIDEQQQEQTRQAEEPVQNETDDAVQEAA